MNSIQDCYVLSNGNKIPCVGFGTWNLTESSTTVDIIKTAIDCGYRHIDTAFGYHNEASVGKAVRTCGLKEMSSLLPQSLVTDHTAMRIP